MRRRSAVEPVIGHLKAEHRMDHNYLAGEHGDAINAVLAAAGYNFSLLLNWFRQLLWLLLARLDRGATRAPHSSSHFSRPTTSCHSTLCSFNQARIAFDVNSVPWL
jgi:hypothetical protein